MECLVRCVLVLVRYVNTDVRPKLNELHVHVHVHVYLRRSVPFQYFSLLPDKPVSWPPNDPIIVCCVGTVACLFCYISLVIAGSDVVLVGRVQRIGSVCNVVEIVQHSQWC